MSPQHSQINAILKTAVEQKASDVHIKSGGVAVFRINGELVRQSVSFTEEIIEDFILKTAPNHLLTKWKESKQVDYAYCLGAEEVGRFRINAFCQRGSPGLCLRHIKTVIPNFQDLNLPEEPLLRVSNYTDGIVLVCGATGSGKSSTLAAILNYINQTKSCNIVTLEDPLEFNYRDIHSIFNQREVGIDTPSFAEGMKAALRQDPDIILIGEMRDKTTFETALNAAETGHLVLSTIHAYSAKKAIQRLFEFFSKEKIEKFKRQIANSLKCVIGQQLVTGLDQKRYPALEIFFIEALAQQIIIKGEFEKIDAIINATRDNGSNSFNDYLYEMVNEQLISEEEAIKASPNAQALKMKIQGIEVITSEIVL